MRPPVYRFILLVLAFGAGSAARAQLSLSSAVAMALQHSPRVQEAEADLVKARAALSESKDAYIPSVGASGGIGKSTGPPLSVPQVFTVSAQSLILNSSQRDFIRSSHAGLIAAELTLDEAKDSLTEQVVETYLSLDNALQRRDAIQAAAAAADTIFEIEQGRFSAGVDPHSEVTRAHRTGVQFRLQAVSIDDEIDELTEHLSTLAGVQLGAFHTVHESIPASPPMSAPLAETAVFFSPAVRAAEASALSKGFAARGTSRYLYRPQLSFGANYSYVDTAFTNYSDYYGLFTRGSNNNPNALTFGIQLFIPLLDYAHRARAREAAADAVRARAEADEARAQYLEGRRKTVRAQRELALRVELSKDDRDIADEQLQAVMIQLQASAGASTGPQLTPRDEQNARLQVQQRSLELLNVESQLLQSQISQMRQNGTLRGWALGSPAPASHGSGSSVTTPAANAVPMPLNP